MRTGGPVGDVAQRISERPRPAQGHKGGPPPLDELRPGRGQVVQGDARQRLGETERRRPHGGACLGERGATEDRRSAAGRRRARRHVAAVDVVASLCRQAQRRFGGGREDRERRRRLLRRDEAERAGAGCLARSPIRHDRQRHALSREPAEAIRRRQVPGDVVRTRDGRRRREGKVEALPRSGPWPLVRRSPDVRVSVPLVAWRLGDRRNREEARHQQRGDEGRARRVQRPLYQSLRPAVPLLGRLE